MKFNQIFLILQLCFFYAEASDSTFQKAKEEGKQFGKNKTSKDWEKIEKISIEDFVPNDQKDKVFNPEEALQRVKDQNISSNEITDFINDDKVWENRQRAPLDPDEYLFKRSEEITKAASQGLTQIEEESEFKIEKCKEIGNQFPLSVNRVLDVEVINHSEIKKDVKACQGHKKSKEYFWKSDAEQACTEIRKELERDITVKTFKVKITSGSLLKDYVVKAKWTHHDDVNTCDKNKIINKIVKPASHEEQDTWIQDKESDLINSPQCTFVKKECIEPHQVRQINGKNIERQCWKEQLTYFCRHDRKRGCEFLANRNCILTDKKCIEHGVYGCALWELTFKCISKLSHKTVDNSLLLEKDTINNEESFSPNTSISSVLTTLSIFEAIKQDMEKSQLSDSTDLQIFKGTSRQCSKNITPDLMYDCCFSFKGLANELKLSHCTADEVALEEMRDKGLCVYIGSYDGKLLNMFTSRKEHVFCCFSTKISRVFQEKAREQMGIDWGKPEKPDCRGLSLDEIARLDFTKLDLSEAFEISPNVNHYHKAVDEEKLKEKCESLEKKLKEKMQNVGEGYA